MNNRIFAAASSETQLLAQALGALRLSTGIEGDILMRRQGDADATTSLHIAGKRFRYGCEIKRKIDRFPALADFKARTDKQADTLLVCNPLSQEMATHCRELDIQFIDLAGNAYLHPAPGLLIYVSGRKATKESLLISGSGQATITPAALRMIFAFLADPGMLNAPYRNISHAVQVSTGAIGGVFETLEERGFIGTTPGGTRIITSPEALLGEWASGYANRLRPKLPKLRLNMSTPGDFRSAWNPQQHHSAWGGEVAAQIITGHLKPASYTIYSDDMAAPKLFAQLIQRLRLRADPYGPIEIIQPFWNMEKFDSFPCVPQHLVYADLIATQDPRNLTVARQIAQNVIEHVHNAQR